MKITRNIVGHRIELVAGQRYLASRPFVSDAKIYPVSIRLITHENADTLLGYLSNFAADGGAVLLVTHDDRAVACAKRVIHLQDGRIAQPVANAL